MTDATPPNAAPRLRAALITRSTPLDRTTSKMATTWRPDTRSSPYLPTRVERVVLAVYPAILLFGALFAVLSPETRAASFDSHAQAYSPSAAPSYFARKDNVLNLVFVKRGWAWITLATGAFLYSFPSSIHGSSLLSSPTWKAKALLRWCLVTGWWVLVTQWCFGPALIDRGFRMTGGTCEAVEAVLGRKLRGPGALSATACRAVGGRWKGGHDISGHVFLLVLGSAFLMQEVGWVFMRAWVQKRSVLMTDGPVEGGNVERTRPGSEAEPFKCWLGSWDAISWGAKTAAGTVFFCLWMMLMTAIYFHTWVEKLTGLVVALVGLYAVYIVPRFVHALRMVIGLPGVF